MERLLGVSSDGHIGAPMADYRPYVEARYREAFDDWLVRHREFEHTLRTTSGYSGRPLPGRRVPYLADDPAEGITANEIADPVTRLGILEGEGMVAEALFPSPDFAHEAGFPFGSLSFANGFFGAGDTDPEHAQAGERAYNRWLADYCSQTSGRAIGLMHPGRYDVEAAVTELRWGKDAGLRGVQIPSDDPNLPPYWHERWEPFWAACADLELPVHFHGGTASGDKALPPGNDAVNSAMVYSETTFWWGRPLKVLIYSGVLERHPRLNLVFTEFVGCDWVPATLARMEWLYKDTSMRAALPVTLRRPPSEYWDRQCYVGASLLSRDDVLQRHQVGVNNMMYGVDFPHPEGSWGRTKEWFQQVFGGSGITEDELRKMLGETAAKLYGLDLDALTPIAERVGFTADEILNAKPRPAEEWNGLFETMPGPYRTGMWSAWRDTAA